MKRWIIGTILILCGCSADDGIFRGWFDQHQKTCYECRDGGELCDAAQFRLDCQLSDEYGNVPYTALAEALGFVIVDPVVEGDDPFPVITKAKAQEILEQYFGSKKANDAS